MSTEPPTDAVPIQLNGQVQDPREEYAQDAKNTDFIVISVYNVLSLAQEDELERLSVNVLEDLGDNNFLCEYTSSDLSPLRALNFVRQVDVYRNKYKIPAALQATSLETANTTATMITTGSSMTTTSLMTNEADTLHSLDQVTVDIFVHETVGNEGFETLKEVIAEASGVQVDDMEFAPGQVRLSVEVDKLAAIAKDDRIRVIEEVLEPQLMSLDNNETGPVVPSPTEKSGTSYRGKDQIITVTDTGFDLGHRDNCHPAFAGRVFSLRAVARKGETDDPHGHGTHVSGILLGSHFSTTKGLIGGIAPEAHLIVQSLFKKDAQPFSLPVDVLDILAVPYDQGSRIFSNSWGVGSKGGIQPEYGNIPGKIDNFIRQHPEVIICFAAGNDNLEAIGQPTVGLHAGSKNVLTVGATGSKDSPDQMYLKSSMGPTHEKRLKPDVVAPGTDIYAALSRRVARFYGDTATSQDMPGIKWWSTSGTSQATPLVAGCAAVLRRVLQERRCTNPPGALLKAIIINGADRLPNVDINAQGYGRVNLDASIAITVRPPARSSETTTDTPLPASSGSLIGGALKQDEEHEFVLSPPKRAASGSHFKITMVYNDIGHRQIQNNLNLFVTDVATGEMTPGNSRSLTDPDEQNNVEQIVLSHIPQGGLKVRVHAQKILAKQDQDYVLAWSEFTPLPGVVY